MLDMEQSKLRAVKDNLLLNISLEDLDLVRPCYIIGCVKLTLLQRLTLNQFK